MNIRLVFFVLILSLLTSVLFTSCSYFNESDTTVFTSLSGTIIEETTGDPVSGVTIRILQPVSVSQSTVSNQHGVFSLTDISISGATQITLEIRKENYIPVYLELNTSAGSTANTGIIQLRASNSFENSSVSGVIYNSTSSDPVADADISILQPTSLRSSTTTDTSGLFSLGELDIESTTQVTIEIRKQGYNTLFIQASLIPGADVSTGIVQLESQAGPSGSTTGGPASITLSTISQQSINIQETGGVATSSLTFSVLDSSGQSIGPLRTANVHFNIVSGTGGNESLTPSIVESDESGTATVHLSSGMTAGIVKVEALIEREDINLTVRSKPITVAIHGGYPDEDHFSIAAESYNFEAWSVNGNRDEISVIVGDKFSNPVKPETPVYFSTDGGVIQGSGITDIDGQISVDLISGNPRPEDYYATVIATTKNENDADITAETLILFSGPPSSGTISVSPEQFNIPANGAQTYQLTITDINGNPLPQGTSVSVSMESDILTLSGSTGFEIPNALYPGSGVTEFTFSVRDLDEENLLPQSFDITVSISTPAGFTAQRTFSD